jgi:hypothetical protein
MERGSIRTVSVTASWQVSAECAVVLGHWSLRKEEISYMAMVKEKR